MRYLLALFISASAAFAATLGQQTLTLSGTATALSCAGQRYVNKLTIRVMPGFEGKVFAGTSSMDPNTYAGTLAILYPNLGAHSEEYVVQDPSGDDGIDLCSIFVAGEIPGENAIAEYVSNNGGTAAPTYLMVPAISGARLADWSVVQLGGTYTLVQVQTIPGYSIAVGVSPGSYYDGIFLSPNLGDITQHNAWSEKWERSDPLGANGLQIAFTLDSVSGTNALLSAWIKSSPATGTLATPSTISTWTMKDLDVGDLPAVWGVGNVLSLRLHKIPAWYYDSKDDVYDSQGNVLGVLFPNTTSAGWSEELDFGNAAVPSNLSVLSDSGGWDLIGFDALLTDNSTSQLPAALSSTTSVTGGYVSGNSAIHRGYVKHLRVQVVPGGEGLVFLGSASMNTGTLDGVYAILYPNYLGRWSETLELDDPEGDGISTDDLYVQTEIAGEQVIVATTTSGVVPPDGVLTVKASGALTGAFNSYAVPFSSSSTPIALLRAQAIPGGYEKLWIGTNNMAAAQPDWNYANVLKVLWPSQGDYDVGEGHSERFVQTCYAAPASAPNCLDLQSFTFWPELPWEQLLVFAMGR